MDESINDSCLPCYYKAASANAAYNGKLVHYYLSVSSIPGGMYSLSVIKSTDELLERFEYFEKTDILKLVADSNGTQRQLTAFKFASVRQAQAFLDKLAEKHGYTKCYL